MIRAVIFDYDWVLSKYFRLQPPMFELAKDLRANNVKTAVLSNRASVLKWYVKRRGTLKDFDPVVYCTDLGHRKPDPAPYKIILEKLRMDPVNCLFIDNRAENIETAQELGMETILAKNTQQTIADIKSLIQSTKS